MIDGQFIKRIMTAALLAACCCLFQAGCSFFTSGYGILPGKSILRLKDAELRDRVKADKFPTPKEAGMEKIAG
jgi:hypothetical protein